MIPLARCITKLQVMDKAFLALTEAPETIDDEVRLLFREKKLQRKAAWEQMRAAFGQLHDVAGVVPERFALPGGWVARPVRDGEIRVKIRGRFATLKKETKEWMYELPLGASAVDLHILAIDADQGSVGTAGFAYLEQVMQFVVGNFPDWYHRMWDDVQMAMKKTGKGSGNALGS